jgi:2-hydroxy-3-oxopropionate reductase
MGTPMASRLLSQGETVIVANRSPEAVSAAVARGARPAATPSAVAAEASVIVTSLPGAAEVREVALGPDGIAAGATARTLVVDTSTLSPQDARMLGAELGAAGVGYIDAPVSGGPVAAGRGSLVVMAGGDPDQIERARPVLERLGTIHHCGPLGAGQVCKACNQLVVVGTIELVAEALALAASAGLDPAVVRAALLGGYAGSRVLEVHGGRMLERDFAPGGRTRFNLKDIDILGALAEAAGLRLPAFDAAAGQVVRLVEAGGGDLDNSALITVLEPSGTVAG